MKRNESVHLHGGRTSRAIVLITEEKSLKENELMNKHILIGNLGRDPELRYTPKGTAVASFPVCANSRVAGEDKAEWFEVNVFGRGGETASQYLKKGDPVYIEGREEVGYWTKRDGTIVIQRKINTNSATFIAKRSANGNGSGNGAVTPPTDVEQAPQPELTDDDVPF
jgi:single-strand DNA-binding protein